LLERVGYAFILATALSGKYLDEIGVEEPHLERIEKRVIEID